MNSRCSNTIHHSCNNLSCCKQDNVCYQLLMYEMATKNCYKYQLYLIQFFCCCIRLINQKYFYGVKQKLKIRNNGEKKISQSSLIGIDKSTHAHLHSKFISLSYLWDLAQGCLLGSAETAANTICWPLNSFDSLNHWLSLELRPSDPSLSGVEYSSGCMPDSDWFIPSQSASVVSPVWSPWAVTMVTSEELLSSTYVRANSGYVWEGTD